MKRLFICILFFVIARSGLFSHEIKVLLSVEKREVALGGELFDFGHYSMNPRKAVAVDGRIFIDQVDTKSFMVELRPRGGVFTFKGRRYRGVLLLISDYFSLYVINKVDVESYLKGVLPKEIIPSWPCESLKAQAIAARTYACRMITDNGHRLWHLDASHYSQVYGGKDGETEETNKAVDQTNGLVLTYRGELITAFYHSTSGGRTARPSDIWKVGDEDYPYLRSVEDPWSLKTPHDSWVSRLDIDAVARAFGTAPLQKIFVEYTSSGRALSLRLVTGRGEIKISGNDFRLTLGASKIKSTYFKAAVEGRELVLRGQGFGHGVGLSQWGARHMAEKGRSYKEILDFYYPGSSVSKIRW